jgi:hypothetical protein
MPLSALYVPTSVLHNPASCDHQADHIPVIILRRFIAVIEIEQERIVVCFSWIISASCRNNHPFRKGRSEVFLGDIEMGMRVAGNYVLPRFEWLPLFITSISLSLVK